MPVPLTPQPASAGYIYFEAYDTPEQRYAQVYPTATTSSVSLSNQSGIVMTTILAKTVYSATGVVTTMFQSGTPNQYIVSRVVSSAPVVTKTFSQSFRVVPSNTTVWNTFGSPSSLLLTSGANDMVAQYVNVVADSIT